jgi:hypothetical protein
MFPKMEQSMFQFNTLETWCCSTWGLRYRKKVLMFFNGRQHGVVFFSWRGSLSTMRRRHRYTSGRPSHQRSNTQKEHDAIANFTINKLKNKFSNIIESTTKNKIEFIHDSNLTWIFTHDCELIMRWRRQLETETKTNSAAVFPCRISSLDWYLSAFSLSFYTIFSHPHLLSLAAIVPAW